MGNPNQIKVGDIYILEKCRYIIFNLDEFAQKADMIRFDTNKGSTHTTYDYKDIYKMRFLHNIYEVKGKHE